MKINFDYYRNLEKVDLFLCNPDGRELFVVPGRNRRIHLRFNDLSELTFDVDAVTTLSDHKIINLEAYDYIQTKRLIYATGIGWFQIEHVDEYDDGVTKYKTVTAESGQAVFKNKGFISEERVYCFYNPADTHDDFYDSSDDSAIPSVMGQWSKQLGIKQALWQGRTEPSEAFEDWTVTYIDPGLIYQGETGVCRTFDENVTYGYDWIANTVSSAFEVVVLFDFLYKTIHVLRPDEATQKTNVIYTFNNFMRQVNVTENAEDIVTVLNCNGSNCDITAVNPTGTNYICDFSYFMDTVNYRWMSAALIAKLNQWYADCEAEKDSYTNMVQLLRTDYIDQTSCKTKLQDASLHLQDLKNAQSKRYTVGKGDPGTLCGTCCAETVEVGQFSLDVNSSYSNTSFNGDHVLTVYQTSPDYDAKNGVWIFSGASTTDTANNIISSNLSDGNTSGISYWYFTDVSDGSSYCRLKAASSVNRKSASSTQYCCGFERYIAYTHPRLNAVTGSTEYTDSVQRWINLYEETVGALSAESKRLDNVIDVESHHLHSISSRLNIISYFSNTPDLLRELNCYWIEGDYTNDNIAVLDTTTPAEEIDLANELMSAGYTELQKMCQPRFSFSLDAIDATKIPEFASQMRMLELGKIVTIEKDEGLWYYPALLSIEMDLDHTDDFRMEFANALRLDDWGYTYADLIASAASTSRKISANWQDLSSYAKDKDTISSLIQDPLDATLRASFANMVNQEFVIDKTGILGRKFESEGSDIFEKEQVRLINNLLIFTDDGWETAKTALGKIYYTDEKGNNKTSYGLVAETLIGSIIIGETVNVRNKEKSITIDKDGIEITNDGFVVFKASTNGTLTISTLDEYKTQVNSKLDIVNNEISAKVSKTYRDRTNSFGWDLFDNKFVVYSAQSAASEEQIIFSKEHVTTGTTEYVDFTIEEGETYSVMYNWNKYQCEARYNDLLDAVVLGNTFRADGVDTGEDFLIVFAQGVPNHIVVYQAYSAESTIVPLLIACPGTVSETLTEVLVVNSSGLQVSGNIQATSGTLENLSIYGKLYFGRSGKDYYIDGGMTSASGKYYVNLPGFQVSEDTAIFSGELKAASGTFSGELIAAFGTFSGQLQAGTAKHPFIISGGKNVTDSPCIYSIEKQYAGSGGYGSVADNRVYIGGDGFSYWLYEPKNGNDYATSIRPGVVFCSGDANRSGTQFTAIAYKHDSITFTYGGITNPRAMTDAYNYYVAKMSVNNGYLHIAGSLHFDKSSVTRVDGIFNFSRIEYPSSCSVVNVDGLFNFSKYSEVNVDGLFNFNTSPSITSDRNKKHDIMQMDDRYGILFDSLLPTTYKYNDGRSGRTHTGFIAQDVMSAISAAGLTTADFAAYVETLNLDGDTVRSLRYEEFVSLNTWQIQKLKARVAELERIVATLQGV